MTTIRWPWTDRKTREQARDATMRDLIEAKDEVSNARKGLEKVLEELQEKRRGLNA